MLQARPPPQPPRAAQTPQASDCPAHTRGFPGEPTKGIRGSPSGTRPPLGGLPGSVPEPAPTLCLVPGSPAGTVPELAAWAARGARGPGPRPGGWSGRDWIGKRCGGLEAWGGLQMASAHPSQEGTPGLRPLRARAPWPQSPRALGRWAGAGVRWWGEAMGSSTLPRGPFSDPGRATLTCQQRLQPWSSGLVALGAGGVACERFSPVEEPPGSPLPWTRVWVWGRLRPADPTRSYARVWPCGGAVGVLGGRGVGGPTSLGRGPGPGLGLGRGLSRASWVFVFGVGLRVGWGGAACG